MILISEKCYYYNNQKVKTSYASKFYYYLNNNHEYLEKVCINFHSTNQIKNWIQKTLSDMYNDVDLKFGETELQGYPLISKYESVKRRISNIDLKFGEFEVPASEV
jgi:hypothetical protein